MNFFSIHIAADFDDGEPDFPQHLSKERAQMVRDAIRRIQASTAEPKLIFIE